MDPAKAPSSKQPEKDDTNKAAPSAPKGPRQPQLSSAPKGQEKPLPHLNSELR